MENSEIFSTRLKELRGRMPQGELGNLLGVSRGSVSFYENGERTPDADFIIKAALYFGVSTDYLLGLSEYKNQDEIDNLIHKVHELEGLDTKQKSILLWSLGVVSERLKLLPDELKANVISWLATLLQSYANMIFLPDNLIMDTIALSSLTSPHRDAINILNELDKVVAEENYKRLALKIEDGDKNAT